MNKVIVIVAIVVFAIAAYLLTRQSPSKPIAELPQIIPQPTAPPALPTIDTSKLVMEDVVVGSGDDVIPGKKVSVQYAGTLADGTEFDSSYKRNNEPLVFIVGAGQMIPGFDAGVMGMKVGGTRKITIPPDLAYGAQAVGPIPANSTLIFEVKLEKVE